MNTFTSIYYENIVDCLILYENSKCNKDNDNTIHKIELEFNEERGIEIELHLANNVVIDMLYVFYLMVCDARHSYHNEDSENYKDFQDFIECKLAAKKLCFLVGDKLYNELMQCKMDFED